MKQTTLVMAGLKQHGRVMRKAELLARMEMQVPWFEFCALIKPHYPKSGNGYSLGGLEHMLRICFVANWFNFADEACEDVLYNVAAFRDFCGFDLGRELMLDPTTLLGFRHVHEAHGPGAAMFSRVGRLLQASGMRLSGGPIVDATLIAAPPSIKNEEKARDPVMYQTKKGNQWHFGMKPHIGTDSQSGLAHSTSVAAANVHDSHEVPNLLYGNKIRFYGDSAYRNGPLTDADKETKPRKPSVHSRVRTSRPDSKSLWGLAKVRYRGLAKNANRAFATLAMVNLIKLGRLSTGEASPA